MDAISRKKFLRICATTLAGGSIALVSAILLRRTLAEKDKPVNTCHSCSGCVKNCPFNETRNRK